MSRYTTSRAKLGHPIVFDHVERRAVAVFPRHPEHDPRAADADAMKKAEVCARAFNDLERATTWGNS